MEDYRYGHQYLISEIESLKEKIARNEKEVDELSQFLQNVISFYETKLNQPSMEKDSEAKMKQLKKKENTKCRYYNRGYCRSKSKCSFFHPQDICEEIKCFDKTCLKRHLKDCKNWNRRNCKFGNNCEYKHDEAKKIVNTNIVDFKIDEVVEEIDQSHNEYEESIMTSLHGDKLNSNLEHVTENVNTADNEIDEMVDIPNIQNYENNDQSETIKCNKCKFTSTNKLCLEKHIKSEHEKGNYTCDKCDYKSFEKQILKRHKETEHKDTACKAQQFDIIQ